MNMVPCSFFCCRNARLFQNGISMCAHGMLLHGMCRHSDVGVYSAALESAESSARLSGVGIRREDSLSLAPVPEGRVSTGTSTEGPPLAAMVANQGSQLMRPSVSARAAEALISATNSQAVQSSSVPAIRAADAQTGSSHPAAVQAADRNSSSALFSAGYAQASVAVPAPVCQAAALPRSPAACQSAVSHPAFRDISEEVRQSRVTARV